MSLLNAVMQSGALETITNRMIPLDEARPNGVREKIPIPMTRLDGVIPNVQGNIGVISRGTDRGTAEVVI